MKKIHISALPTPIWLKFSCEKSEEYMYESGKVQENLLNRVRILKNVRLRKLANF